MTNEGNKGVPKVVAQNMEGAWWKETTAEHEAALVAFVPQVVAELQEKGLWEGVKAEGVALHVLKASFGTLTPPAVSGASPVILKLMQRDLIYSHPGTPTCWGKQQNELAVACHVAWSDAGLAPPVLAHTEDFLVEPSWASCGRADNRRFRTSWATGSSLPSSTLRPRSGSRIISVPGSRS